MKAALVLALAVLAAGAQAQSSSTKSALGAIGRAGQEMADRQLAIDAQVEAARRIAEIELEKERQIRAMANGPATGARDPVAEQMALLDRTWPGWKRVLLSDVFVSWLVLQPENFQNMCRSTKLASEVTVCLNLFLKHRIQ